MQTTLEYVTDGETLFEAIYDVHEAPDAENFGRTRDVTPTIPGRTWRYIRELIDVRNGYAVHAEDLFVTHNATRPVCQAAR